MSEPAPVRTALFIASTPLHTFWSLGLIHGPFAAWRNVVAVVDRTDVKSDFVAEALEASAASPVAEVKRFPALRRLSQARPVLAEYDRWVRRWNPAYIAAGNDSRTEFHAAVAAAPRATRGYLEDGLFSYVPRKNHWARPLGGLGIRITEWRRSLVYGFPVERPTMVGGSRAIQEGWVMLPDQVHAGLSGKTLHEIRPEWFASPTVHAVCMDAARRADFDTARCADIRLLLLLPHESFLQEHPDIARRIEALAHDCAARGQVVAFKCHPRTSGSPIRVPESNCFEIPRRLPIEVLAPLLSDAMVVGTLTTALVSLLRLGRRLEVRSIVPPRDEGGAADRAYNDLAFKIYDAVGIRPLD